MNHEQDIEKYLGKDTTFFGRVKHMTAGICEGIAKYDYGEAMGGDPVKRRAFKKFFEMEAGFKKIAGARKRDECATRQSKEENLLCRAYLAGEIDL